MDVKLRVRLQKLAFIHNSHYSSEIMQLDIVLFPFWKNKLWFWTDVLEEEAWLLIQ